MANWWPGFVNPWSFVSSDLGGKKCWTRSWCNPSSNCGFREVRHGEGRTYFTSGRKEYSARIVYILRHIWTQLVTGSVHITVLNQLHPKSAQWKLHFIVRRTYIKFCPQYPHLLFDLYKILYNQPARNAAGHLCVHWKSTVGRRYCSYAQTCH